MTKRDIHKKLLKIEISKRTIIFLSYLLLINIYGNGGDFWGVNSKSTALSTAQVAGTDDYTAAFYNPSKLAFIGLSNGFGYQYSSYNLDIKFDDNRTDKEKKDFDMGTKELQKGYYSYTLGFTIPVFETKEYSLVFGMVNNYVKNDLAKISVFDEKKYQYYRYHSDVETVLMNAGVGFKFLKRFAIGLGVAQLVSVRGETNVDFSIGNDLDNRDDNNSKIYGKELFLGVVNERSYNLSFFIDANPILIGLIYKESLELPYEIPAVIKIKNFENKDTIIELLLKGMGIWIAPEITLGTTYLFNKGLTLNFDISYQFWSMAPQPYSYTSVKNPDKDSLLYLDTISDNFKIKYNNTINLAFGTSFKKENYELNGGFLYRPSVISKTNKYVNFVDNDVFAISFGSKLNLTSFFTSKEQLKNLYLNFAYSLQNHITKKDTNKYYNSKVEYGGNIHLFYLDISYE